MDLVGGIEAWEAFIVPADPQGDHEPACGG
jgi:hypothetical protein